MTKRVLLMSAVLGWMFFMSPALRAEAQCVGDCNSDGKVAISELILAVDIAGGSAVVADCEAIDADNNGSAQIDELVDAVVSSISVCGTVPTPTFTATPQAVATATPTVTPTTSQATPICGNGAVEGDEECDDGSICIGAATRVACTKQSDCGAGEVCRPSGGDGCAVNCTNEVRRVANLNACTTPLDVLNPRPCAGAYLTANFLTFVELPLSGLQVLTSGTQRDSEWMSLDGSTNDPLKIPIVIKADEVKFDPVNVFNLFCACVVPVPDPKFGIGLTDGQPAGLSGAGLLGCNDAGLDNINILIEQDHNTTPGDPGNSGSANGLPDDPECDDVLDVGDGFTSSACREGTGDACNGDLFVHTGICNSPRKFTYSGGPAGRGSVFLRNQTALKLLTGAVGATNACVGTTATPCPPTFGADCMPCTPDDVPMDEPVANNTPVTSGIAEVKIYDSNDDNGVTIENGSLVCPPRPSPGCVTRIQGIPTDCDALLADPQSPLTGTLATAFPGLDGSNTGDSVTSTSLAAQH